MSFIIFFSIVILIYGLANTYIFIRGLQAIPQGSTLRTWYIWIFWILAASFIAGRFLERAFTSPVTDVVIKVGSLWLAALLYFFLLVVIIDFIRLINYFFHFLPSAHSALYMNMKQWTMASAVILVIGVVIAGYINAMNPRIRNLEVTIDKPANGLQKVKAVVMSDIHLGSLIGNGRLSEIVEKVNSLEPDIILLPGDILDEDLAPVIRQNTGETLRQLSAPLGVYGSMGNHEYIGGAAAAYKYLTEHGITMLRDEHVKIQDSFYIVGREDRDKNRFSGKKRLSLDSLLNPIDFSLPVILLDHQPYHLHQAAQQGVDLQLSGHTHHGQLWPLNYITDAIYTISHGYGKIDNMHAYVSNGVGTWGPPVRTGNRPEIVRLTIFFKKEN